jgi:hypothetical protein
MNDFLEFLSETNGFSHIGFNGMHSDFSLEFIDKCYQKYKRTGKNYLQIAQEIYLISWDFDNENEILSDFQIARIGLGLKDIFILENLSPEIIEKCQRVHDRTLEKIKKRGTYEERRKEANRLLANNNFRERIFNRLGKKCNYCGKTTDLSIDHIRSIYAGGSNDESNFQVLCRSCNSSKGMN